MTVKKVQIIKNTRKTVQYINKLTKTNELNTKKSILERTPDTDILDFMVETFKKEREYELKLDMGSLMKSILQ